MRTLVLLGVLFGAPVAFADEAQDKTLTQQDHTLQQDQQQSQDQQMMDDQMMGDEFLGENEDEVLPPPRDRFRPRRPGYGDFNAVCVMRTFHGRIRGFGSGRTPQGAIRRARDDARDNCLFSRRGGSGRGCYRHYLDCRLVDYPGPR